MGRMMIGHLYKWEVVVCRAVIVSKILQHFLPEGGVSPIRQVKPVGNLVHCVRVIQMAHLLSQVPVLVLEQIYVVIMILVQIIL